MRVALLTDGISPYVTGGMQRHSFNLCRALVREGAMVDLYHCDPHNREAAALDCFTSDERSKITGHVIQFPDFGKMPGHYIRESYEYSCRIAKLIYQNAATDFIYAKGFTAWELLNQKTKGKQLPPIGVNLHGYEMFQKQPSLKSRLQASLFLKAPAMFAVKNADYLFSYGGKITELIRSLGVPDQRIVEIPGGIGAEWVTTRASAPSAPIRFLFAGRSERRKGIVELSAAIRQLQQSHRGKFEFSFLGPFIAHSARIKGCTYLDELQKPEDIREVYRAHDILCVPSYSEGMPNVILEAMASGMAILATDVGAVAALVDTTNGWLLGSPDADLIYRNMATIVGLPADEIFRKKKASVERVSASFTWEIIGKQTLGFIQNAVKK
jgi:glycosyltransferase involved in cell wall biosynthesis